jgi:4'-phosphopantetheinyl transferase
MGRVIQAGPGAVRRPDRASSSDTLGQTDVHLWRIELDAPAVDAGRLVASLSADERARADRYRFPVDRRRFVNGRGMLRACLGRYLSVAPHTVRFGYTSRGKPVIREPEAGRSLDFNVSHAGGIALFAFGLCRRIGVDVERIDPELAHEAVARHFFADGEVAAIRSLSPNLRTRAFFACWTRKEAYVKARGEGITVPLDRFEVAVLPDDPAPSLTIHGDPSETSRWLLRSLNLDDQHAAALATDRLFRLTWIEWSQGRPTGRPEQWPQTPSPPRDPHG